MNIKIFTLITFFMLTKLHILQACPDLIDDNDRPSTLSVALQKVAINHFDTLPDEIVFIIADNLSMIDQMRFGMANWRFNNLMKDNHFLYGLSRRFNLLNNNAILSSFHLNFMQAIRYGQFELKTYHKANNREPDPIFLSNNYMRSFRTAIENNGQLKLSASFWCTNKMFVHDSTISPDIITQSIDKKICGGSVYKKGEFETAAVFPFDLTGITYILPICSRINRSRVDALNHDGSIAVGNESCFPSKNFIWRQNSGVRYLPRPTNMLFSVASYVSDNGEIICGLMNKNTFDSEEDLVNWPKTILWIDNEHVYVLIDLLKYNCNLMQEKQLSRYQVFSVDGISQDGKAMFGEAYIYNNNQGSIYIEHFTLVIK